MGTVILFFFLAHVLTNLIISPKDIKEIVKDIVEEQTGGRLDIDQVSFNSFSGVELKGVRFYPPEAPKGFKYGGNVTSEPLAAIDELNLKYRFWTIWLGMIRINAIQLVRPTVQLVEKDGVMNFAGILAYRKEHFPPVSDPPKEEEKPKEEKPFTFSGLLPVNPKLLLIPLSLKISNVGVVDVRADIKKYNQEKLISHLNLKGPSVDAAFSLLANQTRVGVTIRGGEKDHIELALNESGKQTLLVKTAFLSTFVIENLMRFKLDLMADIFEIEGAGASYVDRKAKINFDIRLLDRLSGVDIDAFDINIADAFIYHLKGAVNFPKDNLEEIVSDIKQDFKVDIGAVTLLAAPFVPGIRGSGLIALEKFEVTGKIIPSVLMSTESTAAPIVKESIDKNAATQKEYPHISALLKIDDVSIDLPKQGVSMGPLAGNLAIAGGTALLGTGPEVEAAINLGLRKLALKQKTPLGALNIDIDDFTTNLTMKALYPEIMLPIFKLNIEAEHIKASGPNISEVDVPLFVSVDADSGAHFESASVAARFELGDLVEFSTVNDCKMFCQKFRTNMALRMSSLEDLYAIVLPLSGKLGLANVLPTKLEGSVDFQMMARGNIPDVFRKTSGIADKFDKKDIGAILKKGDVYFNTQFNLANVGTSLPNLLELEKLNTRFSLTGDLSEQTINLTQNFKKFLLLGPPIKTNAEKPEPEQKVELKRMSTEIEIVNELADDFDIENPIRGLSTRIDSKFYIGKTIVPAANQTLTDIEFGVKAAQDKVTDFDLTEAFVFVPNFGAKATVGAKARLTNKFFPSSFNTNLKFVVDHTTSKKLPGGMQTSGNLALNLLASSADMKTAKLSGDANFEKFSVTIPSKEADQPATLIVENINGKIPFTQILDIPDLNKTAVTSTAPLGATPAPGSNKVDEKVAKKDEKNDASSDGADVAATEAEQVLVDEGLEKALTDYKGRNKSYFRENTNMIAVVDYGNVRPFYPKKKPLSIDRLFAANLDFTNMEFDVELKQNWFAVNQFVINFLGGKIQGDMQLAFEIKPDSPKDSPQALKTSVHLTRLNSQKLIDNFPKLKARATSWSLLSDPYIDGTVHFNFDFKSRDMSGGIEITSIGREQLKMILYYVDPQERDPNIRTIRTALNFGDIRNVSVPLKNGLIGLDVDVRALGAPLPIPKIQKFPISQLIGNFMDQGNKKEDQPQPGQTPTEIKPASSEAVKKEDKKT